jgi:hypothetical protein
MAFAGNVTKANDHSPIGVMGDHLHKQGEFMIGYHYNLSKFSGFKDGSSKISTAEVQSNYGEVGTDIDMRMHMFEIMYGVSDKLTLMLMPQYMEMDMVHESSHGMGHSHKHTVKGLGDTELVGLYSLYKDSDDSSNQRLHLNIGVSLPTGSINKTFVNHHSTVYNLPYNMQFGSGTVDPIIGATYISELPTWSWGAQTINYIRVGKNNNGYRLGNKYTATSWVSRNLNEYVSTSLRLKGEAWDNVSGRDYSLPLNTIVGANPKKLAGERLTAHFGVNLVAPSSNPVLLGHRLALEFGVPLYENFDGPQSSQDYTFTLGWQWAY